MSFFPEKSLDELENELSISRCEVYNLMDHIDDLKLQLKTALDELSKFKDTAKSSKKTHEELAEDLKTVTDQLKPTCYQHQKSGAWYVVVNVALRESDLVVLVQYSPVTNLNIIFSRPFFEFMEKFKDATFLEQI